MNNKHKLGIIVSTIGFTLALVLMTMVNISKVDTAHGSDQYMKGHVIDVQDNILVIQLDGMDEPYPEYYTPVEIRIVDLGSPDPVITPTAGCQNPDTNENC